MKRNCAQKAVDPSRTFQCCFQGFQRAALCDGILSVGCFNPLRDFLEVVKGHLKSLRNENQANMLYRPIAIPCKQSCVCCSAPKFYGVQPFACPTILIDLIYPKLD